MFLFAKIVIQSLEQILKEFLTKKLVAENARRENLEQLRKSKPRGK
jgi:hypothetical protein